MIDVEVGIGNAHHEPLHRKMRCGVDAAAGAFRREPAEPQDDFDYLVGDERFNTSGERLSPHEHRVWGYRVRRDSCTAIIRPSGL